MNSKVVESLIDAGCFDLFGYNHQTLFHNLDSIMTYADLIKDLEPEFVLKPEIEIMEEYPKEYLIQKEKELFGLYLSNHPVSTWKAQEKEAISLNHINEYFNQKVTTIVLIDRMKVIATKKGEEMMFLTGSDEYQSMDFTFFPQKYNQIKTLSLQVGMIVKIIGRVERRYDKFQIVVDQLTILNTKK